MTERDGAISVGALSIEARARSARVVLWLFLAMVPTYLAYSLVPLISPEETIQRLVPQINSAKDDLQKQIRQKGQVADGWFQYSVSELVQVSAPLRAKGEESGPTAEAGIPRVSLRYDRLILWSGVCAVLILAFQTLLPSLRLIRLEPLRVGIDGRDAESKSAPKPEMSAVELLQAEAVSAERRAEVLFARSTLLLGGGIILAFVGVAIFYVTLPDYDRAVAQSGGLPSSSPSSGGGDIDQYWLRAIRPTGVLIFVEAISWFLLRQYRALIEDYKWFHRLYLKRANFLAALKVIDKPDVRPEDLYFATSLLQEDTSGKLKKMETTESLETLRMTDDSPVTEILRTIAAIRGIPRGKAGSKEAKVGESDT